jgi:hypothetical protein
MTTQRLALTLMDNLTKTEITLFQDRCHYVRRSMASAVNVNYSVYRFVTADGEFEAVQPEGVELDANVWEWTRPADEERRSVAERARTRQVTAEYEAPPEIT